MEKNRKRLLRKFVIIGFIPSATSVFADVDVAMAIDLRVRSLKSRANLATVMTTFFNFTV